MVHATEVPLQRLYMAQAIELFQTAYAPYVLDHMRAHFGERLSSHLHSLAKRERTAIYVDFVDGQPRPDFLALIHLMTHDGGLHTGRTGYASVLFAPNGSAQVDVRPAFVPPLKELRLIRLRRNALNHQGQLTGAMIIDSIARMMQMVALLPEHYQSAERRIQLQLVYARAQSLEYASQLTAIQQAQQQHADAVRQKEQYTQYAQQILDIEASISTHQQETQQTQRHLETLQLQVSQLRQDQLLLVSGTAEAVVDGRRMLEERIDQLQHYIAALPVPKGPDTQTLLTLEKVHRVLAAQQQITADMRIEINRLHERVDTLHDATVVTMPRRSRRGIVVVLLFGSVGWLWYSGWLMWGIERMQPIVFELLARMQ